jgi:nucleoid DNA-binding protein
LLGHDKESKKRCKSLKKGEYADTEKKVPRFNPGKNLREKVA